MAEQYCSCFHYYWLHCKSINRIHNPWIGCDSRASPPHQTSSDHGIRIHRTTDILIQINVLIPCFLTAFSVGFFSSVKAKAKGLSIFLLFFNGQGYSHLSVHQFDETWETTTAHTTPWGHRPLFTFLKSGNNEVSFTWGYPDVWFDPVHETEVGIHRKEINTNVNR